MADIIQIPRSNTLRFVRAQTGEIQTFDNVLLEDETFLQYTKVRENYRQKLSASDVIWLQWASDISTMTLKIYDLDDVLVADKTSIITSVLSGSSFSVYQAQFTIGVAGEYYAVLEFDSGQVYESERFQITNVLGKTVSIQYRDSDTDGIVYADSTSLFPLRIEGRLAEYRPGMERTVYTSFNEKTVNLRGLPLRMALLEFGPLPRYMLEKLNIALAHQKVLINGVEYQVNDTFDGAMFRDDYYVTDMYHGSCLLRQVYYEIYEDATEEEDVETYRVLIDTEGSLLLNTETDYTLYQS